jgi:Domain of unknown function (DUF4294)
VKKKSLYILIVLTFSSTFSLLSQKKYEYVPGMEIPAEVIYENGDTIYQFDLNEIYTYETNKFASKEEEKIFWQLVRDLKVTLPYAKLIGRELNKTNKTLSSMSNDKDRKKYIEAYEKAVFKKYEADLKKMTVRQGKLLFKLIDRECEQTPYELIKIYRGSFSAFFWQSVARLFGSNLKAEYDINGNDKTIEKIIKMIESGQL